LLSVVPDNGVTDVLECIVEVVKEVASRVALSLPGLQAMSPSALTRVNETSVPMGTEWFAIASDYEPTVPIAWRQWVADTLMDAVFHRSRNDLVVPTAGCYEGRGAGFPTCPETRRLVLDAGKGVTHVSYFEQPLVVDAILRWLTPEAPRNAV